jgi:hypothetical protein
MSGGALIDLALCFPQESRLLLRRPYLRWFGYASGVGLAAMAFSNLYDFQNPTAYFASWRNIYIFIGISALFYFGALTVHAFLSHSPVVKSQARTILFGVVIAFGRCILAVVFLVEKCGGIGGSSSVQSIPLRPLHPLPSGKRICDPAFPPPAHRLLGAPGHGVFPADSARRGGIWSVRDRHRLDRFEHCQRQ